MSLLKTEYDKNDNMLEQLVSVAMPFNDEYIKSMIHADQKARYDGINKPCPENLVGKDALVYVTVGFTKYVTEGLLVLTAMQTLLR